MEEPQFGRDDDQEGMGWHPRDEQDLGWKGGAKRRPEGRDNGDRAARRSAGGQWHRPRRRAWQRHRLRLLPGWGWPGAVYLALVLGVIAPSMAAPLTLRHGPLSNTGSSQRDHPLLKATRRVANLSSSSGAGTPGQWGESPGKDSSAGTLGQSGPGAGEGGSAGPRGQWGPGAVDGGRREAWVEGGRVRRAAGLRGWEGLRESAADRANISARSKWAAELARWSEQQVADAHFRSSRRKLARMRACDYTKGRWVFDQRRRPWYSGSSCAAIRSSFNCQRNGRKDSAFFKQRWTPAGCSLPQFNADKFLSLLRNKIVGFVGDSVARNFQQAIACQLGSGSRSKPWIGRLGGIPVAGDYYPTYNVRTFVVVSPYLMRYSSSAAAFLRYGMRPPPKYSVDSYVIWLDQPDPAWANLLPYVDLMVFIGSHWYVNSVATTQVRRSTFIYGNKPQNLSGLTAYSIAVNALKRFVLKPKFFGGVPMFVTYSPSHYNRNNPPSCPEAGPIPEVQVDVMRRRDPSAFFRQIEVSTFNNTRFKILDITPMSLYRADAHVKTYYGLAFKQNQIHTRWDCLHWCLPGLPDVWGDAMQFVLQTQLWSF